MLTVGALREWHSGTRAKLLLWVPAIATAYFLLMLLLLLTTWAGETGGVGGTWLSTIALSQSLARVRYRFWRLFLGLILTLAASLSPVFTVSEGYF
jgi:hypothetical protein